MSIDHATAPHDVRFRQLIEVAACRLPHGSSWQIPEHPKHLSGWYTYFREVAAWCTERWGAPAVRPILYSFDGMQDAEWRGNGSTWALLGSGGWFKHPEQAFEFRMRWGGSTA